MHSSQTPTLCYTASAQRWKGDDMWFREGGPQREQPLGAFADISLKEQGRKLEPCRRNREGEVCWGAKSPNSARTLASLSCQVDGRPRNMTWSYCWGRAWWYKNYSTWIMVGSIGRQSHYRGARVQCLPGAASWDIFITMAMCSTHNTQVGSCVVIFCLLLLFPRLSVPAVLIV